MKTDRVRRSVLIASSLLATGALVLPSMAQAQALKPGKLRAVTPSGKPLLSVGKL